MSEKLTEKFINALSELESGENTENIVELFADDCEIGNSTLTDAMNGKDGARNFWTSYRKTLGEVKSEFRNKIISEKVSVLEWTTKGTNSEGNEINYNGVSILENNGEKITRFHACFNPSELGHQLIG